MCYHPSSVKHLSYDLIQASHIKIAEASGSEYRGQSLFQIDTTSHESMMKTKARDLQLFK